ncbi:MAG: class I SAM-dependent methyltransferase [Burkholderiales bacterium]
MGDINQYRFVQKHRVEFCAPFLEAGAHDYGTTQNLRSLFPEAEYLGVDLRAGPGVDVVLDLTRPFEEIDRSLGGKRFSTIFCLSVLEHCDQPFVMSDNMVKLLKPGGKIYVSVPFAWKFHGYPSDYWRFTHEGVKKLFPTLEFDTFTGNRAASAAGYPGPLGKDIGLIQLSGRWHRERRRFVAGLETDFLELLSRLGIMRWLFCYRYVLAPTMIDMVGIAPASIPASTR